MPGSELSNEERSRWDSVLAKKKGCDVTAVAFSDIPSIVMKMVWLSAEAFTTRAWDDCWEKNQSGSGSSDAVPARPDHIPAPIPMPIPRPTHNPTTMTTAATTGREFMMRGKAYGLNLCRVITRSPTKSRRTR